MNSLFRISIFIVFFSAQSLAADIKLTDSIRLVTKTLRGIEESESTCVYCQHQPLAHDQSCPQLIKDSYQDIHRMGSVGRINNIISDGSLKNPRTVCSAGADAVKKIKIKDLYSDLQSEYPDTTQLYQFSQKCNTGINNDDSTIATAYMTYDFNNKSNAITNAMDDLIDSKAQINSIIDGDTKLDCKKLGNENIKKHCEQLSGCSTQNRKELFDMKNKEVSEAVGSLQKLNSEYNEKILAQEKEFNNFKDNEYKLFLAMCRPYGCNRQTKAEIDFQNTSLEKIIEEKKKLTTLQEARTSMINELLKSNPLLKGEKFSDIVADATPEYKKSASAEIAPEKIEKALKDQLATSQKNINQKISDFNDAYNCLVGRSSNCKNFDNVLKQAKRNNKDKDLIKKHALSTVANFYSCIENVSESRNVASEKINDAAFDAAFSLATMGGGAAYGAIKRAAGVAEKLASVEQKVKKVNTVFTLFKDGYKTKDEYDMCTQVNNDFEVLGSNKNSMSCGNINNILVNKVNSSNCTNRALSQTFSHSSNFFKHPLIKHSLGTPEKVYKANSLANKFLNNDNDNDNDNSSKTTPAKKAE